MLDSQHAYCCVSQPRLDVLLDGSKLVIHGELFLCMGCTSRSVIYSQTAGVTYRTAVVPVGSIVSSTLSILL